jgi:adenosine deaminase
LVASLIQKAACAPKAELHMHIEGSLQPEMIFALASRNGLTLPFDSVESLRQAYAFQNLQSFLDLYHAGTQVLMTEEDFFDVTAAYVERAIADNVVHAEIFFDPQTHLTRGVTFDVMIAGMERALKDAEVRGFSSRLLLCFVRHLSEDAALQTFDSALPFFKEYSHRLVGIGLDSTELGIPPSTFSRVFARARSEGLRCVAHAGEEGPPEYVAEALDSLRVERIDHGVTSIRDMTLVKRLADLRVPLTVCPLSNLRLKGVIDMKAHPLRMLLEAGVLVSVNSDDPAYFGGYVNANYASVIDALQLNDAQIYRLIRNSFQSAFVSNDERATLLLKLDNYWTATGTLAHRHELDA